MKQSTASYNLELEKYLPAHLMKQMKLVDEFNVTQSQDSNGLVNAKVFSLTKPAPPTPKTDKTKYSKNYVNKVNTIISEQLDAVDHEILAQNWLEMAYGDIVKKSKSKCYLFKLLEFNKNEMQNNH